MAVSPCCIPSKPRQACLEASRSHAAERPRVTNGSVEGMVLLGGEAFLMGSETPAACTGDGEGPVRSVHVDPFYIARHAVTNEEFGEFVRATGYATEAERYGWSAAFRNLVPDENRGPAIPELPWWLKVDGARWRHPEGPGTAISGREDHPVVHVSWNDAQAFCEWRGARLPTEAEWEYAARGGLEQNVFPWGDELKPGGRFMCNIWQGTFPDRDLGEDGFTGTAPVGAYDPNGYGLCCVAGNTWEWCNDFFDATWHVFATRENPLGPPTGQRRVLKGGSFLCHASYCFRYRNAARTGNEPESTTANAGFRIARDVC